MDIAGAILIFFYGIAPQLSRYGHMTLIAEQTSHTEARKAKTYDFRARAGAMLVFVGFVLQFLGNHIAVSFNIIDVQLFLFLAILVVGLLLLNEYRNRKNLLSYTVQYLPQFSKEGLGKEHFWLMKVRSNAPERLQNVEVYLTDIPNQIQIQGKAVEQIEGRSLIIEHIDPDKEIAIKVWGMAGYDSAGADCYLVVNNKITRPRLIKTLEF